MKKTRITSKKVMNACGAVLALSLIATNVQYYSVEVGASTVSVNGQAITVIPGSLSMNTPAALSTLALPASSFGTLSWANPATVPAQYSASYPVILKVTNTQGADFSKVPGWNPANSTVSGSVTVVVQSLAPTPAPTKIPAAPTPTQIPPTPTVPVTPNATVAPTPEVSETPNATVAPTPEVSETPNATVAPTPEVSETPNATVIPTPEASETPNATVIPTPEATETPDATATPTPEASETPDAATTPVPTETPNGEITSEPTQTPVEGEQMEVPDITEIPEMPSVSMPEFKGTVKEEIIEAGDPFEENAGTEAPLENDKYRIAGSKPLVGGDIADKGYGGTASTRPTATKKPISSRNPGTVNNNNNNNSGSSTGTSSNNTGGYSSNASVTPTYTGNSASGNSVGMVKTKRYGVLTGDNTDVRPYIFTGAAAGLVALLTMVTMRNRRRRPARREEE